MRDAVVIPTGTANLASVVAGLRRAGVDGRAATGSDDIFDAQRVVLPGVGSFGAAIDAIDRLGLREALIDYVRRGRPLLAICLGMQLLCISSEESPGVQGLGIIDEHISRIPDSVRVPQLGWNRVEPAGDTRLLRPGWAYFANSYRLIDVPDGWLGATAEYGGEFTAAVERDAQLACQFHPELSGAWGTELIRGWVERTVRVL